MNISKLYNSLHEPAAASFGLGILAHIMDADQWLSRRVESLEVLDGQTVRRHISLDLKVQNSMFTRPTEGVALIPMAILSKTPLISFDLKDSNGASISVPTKLENGLYSSMLLAGLAYQILGKGVPLDIAKDIKTLVLSSGIIAETALKDILAPAQYSSSLSERLAISKDPVFAYWAHRLTECFILFAELKKVAPLERVVLKYSHTDSMLDAKVRQSRRKFSFFVTPFKQLGYWPSTLELPLTQAHFCESFHFEFTTPLGVKPISAAAFKTRGGVTAGPAHLAKIEGSKVHINLDNIRGEDTLTARILVNLTPSWGIPSLIASLVTFLALGALMKAGIGLPAVSGPAGLTVSAIAILAALLSITLPLLLNSTKSHPFVTRKLKLNLILASLAVSLPGVALACISLPYSLRPLWTVLIWISGVLVVLLILSPIMLAIYAACRRLFRFHNR